MKTIDVTAQEKCRLDVLLSQTQLTRSHAQKLIHGGAVTVNGKVVQKVSAEVTPGAEVRVQLPEEVPLEVPPQDIDIDVVYQDEWLAVINKPQGLTVHPANNVNTDTLVNALLFHIKDLSGINGVLRPGIVHRLDKDTSGLLVVAKNDAAHVIVLCELAYAVGDLVAKVENTDVERLARQATAGNGGRHRSSARPVRDDGGNALA